MPATNNLKDEYKLYPKYQLCIFVNPKIIRSYMLFWYFGRTFKIGLFLVANHLEIGGKMPACRNSH